MHYKEALGAFIALSAVASAAPSTPSDLLSKFRVSQVSTGKMVPRSGPAAYRKALSKYGVTVPTEVSDAAAAQQSGSVTASPTKYDSEYLCPVTAGSSQLTLDFDTGSADLWAFSSETPSSEQGSHSLYDTSSGQQIQGATWKISYGDGSSAGGDVFTDTVKIGGVTATGQAVEAATSASQEFVSGAGDGLVGLAFSSINTVKPQQQQTFFDTVKSSLPSPLFTATLKYETPGSYDFGFIDHSKYTGDITYAPVDDSNGFWEFTADGFKPGGGSAQVIADTGTSLILVSQDVLSAYYGGIQGAKQTQGSYVFPCSASLPDFGVTVGGQTFTVPGKYLNYAPNGDGTCYGGLQSSSGIGFNILGDVFLKAQFVVFDGGNTRIGLAPQSGVATNSTADIRMPSFRL